MFVEITTKDIIFLSVAIGAWTILGIFMYIAFLWLQRQERDTPFPEESGLKPDSIDLGRGGMNGARPTRKPYSRLALYPNFFVAGFKSQRVCLPYDAITKVERIPRGKYNWLMIHATQPKTNKEYEMYFFNKNVDNIQESIEAKL